jgi:hypothetical protein
VESQVALGLIMGLITTPCHWKDDNGKLTKKYIGKYRPSLENPKKGENRLRTCNESNKLHKIN